MLRRMIPLALSAGLLAGCALSAHPRIAEIKQNPGYYQNHSVTIDGVVTSSWNVPMVPVKMYKVDDGSGEVTIVSQRSHVPSKGERVSVKGRVNELAVVGGQSVGLHLEEEHLSFKQ